MLNPCAAELFAVIFHSFEAGIASNNEKYLYLCKNRHLEYRINGLTTHLPQHILSMYRLGSSVRKHE